MEDTTLLLFCDDSKSHCCQYESYAVISITSSYYNELLNDLKNIIRNDSGIASEYKWSKLNSAKYTFASKKIIDFVFKHEEKIKIDVIIWDNKDSRRTIRGVDKTRDKQAMYFYIFNHVLNHRNPDKYGAEITVDTQNDISFDKIKRRLDYNHDIREIKQTESHHNTFVQVADLFAGMACYSYYKYSNPNGLNENKEEVLKYFNDKCKSKKLHIALKTTKGLYSHKPSAFLNFWLYKPQGDYDKAPISFKHAKKTSLSFGMPNK